MARGFKLVSGEDDFDDFKIHQVKDGPNVPTFCHTLCPVFVDFSRDSFVSIQSKTFLNKLVDRCFCYGIAHRDFEA